jgi:hypothetical protein
MLFLIKYKHLWKQKTFLTIEVGVASHTVSSPIRRKSVTASSSTQMTDNVTSEFRTSRFYCIYSGITFEMWNKPNT